MTPSQAKRKPKRQPKRVPKDHYSVPSYDRAIARACKRAKVPSWHPHQLRHNAGTLLRAKYGIEVARIILGHTGIQATELYAEADRQQAVDVMKKIG